MEDKTGQFELNENEKKLLEELLSSNPHQLTSFGSKRRLFLKQIAALTGSMVAVQVFGENHLFAESTSPIFNPAPASTLENGLSVTFSVNNIPATLDIDSRMTLLDTLRERLQLTGSKKGCDHGQCGACTVMVDGRRVLSCLTLTATCQHKNVTTVEGLAKNNQLHPVQAAFIKHDGFQCGYCTPGQLCSAVALLDEAKRGEASYVTENLQEIPASVQLSDDEIRERMSGNICRCGAYPNIVAAIKEVHSGKEVSQFWQFIDENNLSPAGYGK